ncbi:MAG: hypothetical protein JKY48_16775, partial [Flavobacteriales bacterium]|nr:hypothetical protein [Flavobacteriales bacterium]
MNDFQAIKRMLLPLLKGLPIILICLFVALSIAYRSVLYTNPIYESTVKIKLDDINHGVSSSALYADFDVFANTNKIAAEVEVLKSKALIEKAIKGLDFDVTYYRVGKIRTKELYHEKPFYVQYEIKNDKIYNQLIHLNITSEQSFVISYLWNNEMKKFTGSFGASVESSEFNLTIQKNDLLRLRKGKVDLIDQYQFRINSVFFVVNTIIGGNLTVMSIDDDVAVLSVTYKSEVADKSSIFAN